VRLAGLLTLARLALSRWPLREVMPALRRSPAPGSTGAAPVDPARLALLVHHSTRLLPWRANCLHRSLVLWWLLDRRGVPAQLRLGVRRLPGADAPDFHAWVELEGRVLNDRPDIREHYSVFEAVTPGGANS
jgi:hypothetical protein